MKNPVPDQKNPIYFYYTKKTRLVNYFQKQYSQVPAKFRFCEK